MDGLRQDIRWRLGSVQTRLSHSQTGGGRRAILFHFFVSVCPWPPVARIAQAHGLNANLVFNWRRLHQKGLLTDRRAAKLLPVRVSGEVSPAVGTPRGTGCEPPSLSKGTIHIQLQKARVWVEGVVNEGLVRVVLEC